MRRVRPPTPQVSKQVEAVNKRTFLSTWFPQWWYSTSVSGSNVAEDESKIDDEILDVFASPNDTTFLKRDVVFGNFNFSLKQGSIRLCAGVYEKKQIK